MFSFQSLLILVLYSYGFNCKDAKPPNLGIVGGHNVTIEQFPFVVSVRIHNGTFHFCGGSIVHPLFIATAAHCILPDRKYSVKVGTDKLNEGGTLYNVTKIIPHEKYNSVSYENDICILKLEKPLEYGKKVNRVSLPEENFIVKKRTLLATMGWGLTSPSGNDSINLLEVLVPAVPLKRCQRMYGLRWIPPTTICAGGKGRDTCQGDSGGPLTLNGTLVGVTSAGGVCGDKPGVYTKVTAFLDWIRSKMIENS